MRRLLTRFGFVAVLALLLAACGGDDTLSEEAYFRALEDVSTGSDARAGDLAPPDAETEATYLAGFQTLWANARADVAALTAPSDLAAAHDAFVAAMDAVIDALGRARAQAEAGEDPEALFETPAAYREVERTCTTLRQLAVDRGVAVDLRCGG